jgi:hypothetical protein
MDAFVMVITAPNRDSSEDASTRRRRIAMTHLTMIANQTGALPPMTPSRAKADPAKRLRVRRVPALLFGSVVAAARRVAAIARSRAERTVVERYAGWKWSDGTERALVGDLTGRRDRW